MSKIVIQPKRKTNRDVPSEGAYTDGEPWSWITQVQKLLRKLHKTKTKTIKILKEHKKIEKEEEENVPEMAGVRRPSPITIQVPRRTRINKAV